jgi:hypothetical protein
MYYLKKGDEEDVIELITSFIKAGKNFSLTPRRLEVDEFI